MFRPARALSVGLSAKSDRSEQAGAEGYEPKATTRSVLRYRTVLETVMKDVFAVLRQREIDLARVRKEIDALRLVIPLLVGDSADVPDATDVFSASSRYRNKWPLEIHSNPT